MDSFEFNKIAGAILIAALVAFGLGVLSDIIFEGHEAEAPGYVIEVAESGGEAAAEAPVAEAPATEAAPVESAAETAPVEAAEAPAAAAPPADAAAAETAAEAAPAETPAEAQPAAAAASPVLAMVGEMSADDGKKVAKKCAACHAFDEGGKNKVGPPLWGILNRAAGTADKFKYSDAMKAFGENGSTWDYAALDAYLANPKGTIPGTKMSFAGLKKEKDRAAILAYLRTLAAEPVALP